MKYIKYLIVVAMVMAVAACGGGGGSSTVIDPGTKIPTGADFIFELDKTSIVNSGGDKAVLTVTVLDEQRNVVKGVPVSVSVDSNGVFTASSEQITDVSGKFSGVVTIGGDKINRVISATIKVNDITKVASIVVTGSQISITPVPATPAPGQLVTLNIATTDSANSPIQYASLLLSGTAGLSGSVKTDVSGNKVSTFNAPALPGSYTVVVSGLGVSMTKTIEVIAPGGSGKPVVDPSLAISSASLNPLPTSILANLVGSSTNRSKLSAKFLTTGNSAIENMRVKFKILPPALGNGEVISTGDATVYTDASGVAEADYISGTRTSPTNGVSVRACYKKTDFTDVNDCPMWVDANLTVAGTPLSISITDDNKMSKGLGEIAYVKQFLIQVNDAAGGAVSDAIVSASVDITHYGKGEFGYYYPNRRTAPTIADGTLALDPGTRTVIDSNNNISAVGVAPWSQVIIVDGKPVQIVNNVWCVNEDKNRNGFLDTTPTSTEDVNRDGVLQPRKAEIIVSYVNGNRTNADGQMLVQITYGQNMARWLAYTLRATTGVAGSEGDASKSYITDALEDDIENGSFWTPPFGTKACNSRN